MENGVYLKLALVVALIGVTQAPNSEWFYCHGDICYLDQEVFCCDLLERCRLCTEILDDCFTPEMPPNCTQTCLNDYFKRKLKIEQDKPCKGLKRILHGNHNGTHSDQQKPGSSIQFSCQNGYRLIGQDILQCKLYGQWSSPPPICKEITCAVLSSINHGKHNGSAWKLGFGTVVVTVCNDGTKLYGQNETTCSHGGQWTNNLPTCEPMICPEPPPIRNGRWEPSRQTLHVKCDSGYSTDSFVTWTCQEGLWYSNDSFFPVCFNRGDSVNSTRIVNHFLILSIIFNGLLVVVCIIGGIKILRDYKAYKKHYGDSFVDGSDSSLCGENEFLNAKVNSEDSRGNSNVTPKPQQYISYKNNKTSIEETGESSRPAADDTARKQPKGRPLDAEIMQSELPIASMPDSDGSLNVEQLGGTAPMKRLSGDIQTAIGTQPLKPVDEYIAHTESNHLTQRLNEVMVDSESDEDGEVSYLLSNSLSSVQTADEDIEFPLDNFRNSDNNSL